MNAKGSEGRRPAVNKPGIRAAERSRAVPAEVRNLYEFGSVGYFTLSAKGRIRSVSDRGAQILHRNPEPLVGRSFLEFVALGSRDVCREHFRLALETGMLKTAVLRMDAGRGVFFWASVESVARTRRGDRFDLRLALTDVSDRVLAEQASARLVAAVEQAGEALVIIQPEGQITYVNRMFETSNEIGRSGLLERSYFKIFGPLTEGTDWPSAALDAIARGSAWTGRVSRRGRDGRKRILLLTLSPIRGPSGQIFSYLVLEKDMTREAVLEDHLHQVQKYEALGTLAGGIAHDLNNALGPIILNAELILLDSEAGDGVKDRLQILLRSAERAKNLVRQILTITSRRQVEKKAFRLSSLVRDSFSFLRASLPSTVEMQSTGLEAEGLVFADRGQIEQVILNLVANAAHAMREKGGKLTIDLVRVSISPAERELAGLRPGPYLRVTVSDTGPGIDPGIMSRIFDPFFTTKPQGEGLGLGLSVVRGILEAHDGAVIAFNDPAGGAVFSFYLPETEAKEEAAQESHADFAGAGGRILLVDDEEVQVLSWKLALERLGYLVTSTTSPEEALRRFVENPTDFDLMITDQTMPRLTGWSLAAEVMRVRPGFPVILCTGYSDSVNPVRARLAGIRVYLRKPLGLAEMARAVRVALDRGEAAGSPRSS